MDEGEGSFYLGGSMLRRLLACFAILTGLAAANAPAHATIVSALEAQIEDQRRADDPARSAETACVEKQRKQRLRGERITPCRAPETVTVYVPTVMFGPDRAHE